jgi:8-oxo-dGTP pyrophosphatase MutT (NUDIX family)
MPQFLPAPLHRTLLPLAHIVRHYWRRWRGVSLAGVSVIITNLGGDVLLLKHTYGPKVWGLPGGGLRPGEDPEAAARREVLEELGITLTRIDPIGTLEEVLSGSPHTAHLFAATCDQHPRPDRREILEARYFPSHSLPEPLGRITRARIDAWRKRGMRR